MFIVFFSTDKTHFIPGKDRSQPYQLELVFRLRPLSVTKISMEFDRAFLKWTEYPPDANHGFYVNSAVISAVLPSGSQYTAVPQSGSLFRDRCSDMLKPSHYLMIYSQT
ncbi:hypothetical protein DPMN_172937 [Dreissena polymorpha]|uniref:Uncharacterized protein n=1 Tax=Dreissena polymorpha TaxID=45954 RepID=A0A9D4E388_DREPO|nr:hypothetical protein DPMN_172937 [Dreissena polymorpha]